jgi:hypothetical protein
MTTLRREDVIKIKDLLRMKRHSGAQLAKMFGVGETTIYHIKRGLSWAHVQLIRRL